MGPHKTMAVTSKM